MAELLLATAGEDVRLWTMPDLNLHSVKSSSSTAVTHCTCSNNGQMLAYSNEGQGINVSPLQGDSSSIWEIPTACEQSNVAFSNNSRLLVSGGRDCVVNVWDVKSRSVRRTFRDQINPISFCVFNFNDKIVASSSDQGEIILTEVSTGLASDPLIGVDTETINCLQYSHFTHNLLASAGGSGAVTLWDTSEKKLLRTFAEHSASSTCLSFSPLNDMLLSSTGFDKRIIFYDVCYKKIVKTINSEEPLTCCDFLHDGTTVSVGSATGHIFLFDLRHGATPLTVIPAHRTSVRSSSFQKIPKEKNSKRQSSHEAKLERQVSSTSSSHLQENIGTPMEVSSSSQLPTKFSRNSQLLESMPSEEYERLPSREEKDSWRLSSGKSIENLQPSQPKYPKMKDEIFSPLEVDSGGRKPVKRSKSALKKYDLSSKSSTSESETPGMGARSKSGLSRLSLLSRSTGDLSKGGKKKEKENEDISGVVKKNNILKDAVDGRKGLFKSPFRKKNTTDYSKRSDESETSSVESVSIEDKIYLRGKKSHASNRSNESDTKSTDIKVSESFSGKHIIDHKQFMNEIQDNLETTLTGAKSSKNISPVNVNLSQYDGTRGEKFQLDFIQKIIDDAMEDNRTAIHNDIINMQFECIRQMEIQKEQIRQMLEHYSINDDLVKEIQRLRVENEMLKKKY